MQFELQCVQLFLKCKTDVFESHVRVHLFFCDQIDISATDKMREKNKGNKLRRMQLGKTDAA